MRKAGILTHITSLPSKYGIGSFGKEAYCFVDFLRNSGQKLWQILPLGPTSYGDSPYQTFSSYAINPYFIDLDLLINDKLLSRKDIVDSTSHPGYVDYEKIYNERYIVLKEAFNKFDLNNIEFMCFVEKESYWLNDYSLFMALKNYFGGNSWDLWPDELRFRHESILNDYKNKLKNEINFQKFMQYMAYKQWNELKRYANQNEIEIIGDIPIYVAYDSSDVWANPKQFMLDENLKMNVVAGVPPDGFSIDGQLWGNPLYNWEYQEKEEYSFWIKRVESSLNLYDYLRIDHFIGFVHFYSIPYGELTARNGVWLKGPSEKLFDKIKEKLGDINVIAEDLGVVTDEVIHLLDYTKFPGMKLIHFAFGSDGENDNLTHNHKVNNLIYTGTHDNFTSKQWFETLPEKEKEFALNYINHTQGSMVYSLIKEVLKSPSKIAIIPIQDYLEKGEDARMNEPATLGGNWVWRIKKGELNKNLEKKIKKLSVLTGRYVEKEERA